MRGWRKATVVVMAALGVVAGVVAGPAPASAAAAVTVTPADGLLADHVVAVEASGLTPGVSHLVTQCGPQADGPCTADPTEPPPASPPSNVAYVTADGQGRVTTRLELGRTSPCLRGTCSVRVFALGDDTVLAAAPLTFVEGGEYQWPTATLVVESPGPVIESSPVAVTAAGLDPWFPRRDIAAAAVLVCRDDSALDPAADCNGIAVAGGDDLVAAIPVAPDGTGTATVPLPRHLSVRDDSDYDCAVEGCVIVASQRSAQAGDGEPVTNAVPLPFAPEWAPWASAADMVRAIERVAGGPVGGAQLAQGLEDRAVEATPAFLYAAGRASDPASRNWHPGEVHRLYRAFFGRAPETGGLDHWVRRLRSGSSLSGVARAFGGTPEFRAAYGTVGDATVVDRAYRNTLGREPDADGRAYWIGRLRDGLSRPNLLLHFARSREMRSGQAGPAALTAITYTLAGRAPTTDELVLMREDGGGPSLSPGHGPHAVVAALIASGELLPD